ncbi:hypothetical protein [Oceanicoccus sagamiensis]|uniref:Uncharacterized protein n=1 Tax=Oceanicoccus sagamiensis TaxID=716816 RepID=A0A1X9NF70_9GAMM|nr:hypothetical protein [Oceanicoccus sagamiensis]ARN74515.1 hypothetical protein BST96_10525 [Oceanicoccus sagamiensis]
MAEIKATGLLEDGEIITLEGSGMGSHLLDIGVMGNKTSPQKTGQPGEKLANNVNNFSYGGGVRSDLYVYEGEHSRVDGEPVITGNAQDLGAYKNATLVYDFGEQLEPGSQIYFTYWVKMNSEQSEGQWKMWRVSNTDNISDHTGEIVRSNWTTMQYAIMHTTDDGNLPRYYLEKPWDNFPNHGQGEWTRVEASLTMSNYNVDDGILDITTHDRNFVTAPFNPEMKNYRGWTAPNMANYTDPFDRYRYLILQNYFGNGYNNADVYIEDLYVQHGEKKRLEICESENWVQCAHREIQFPSSWTDTELTFELNYGSFNHGDTVFVHIIDNNDVSIASTQITLGENLTAPVPPNPPNNITIE